MVMSAAQTGKHDAVMAAFSDSTKKEANGGRGLEAIGRGLQSLRSVSALEDEEKRVADAVAVHHVHAVATGLNGHRRRFASRGHRLREGEANHRAARRQRP